MEVQQALLAFGTHEKIGRAYEECNARGNGMDCNTATPRTFDTHARCDTTKELAELTALAARAGKCAGFRTSKSYFQTRTMHEAAGKPRSGSHAVNLCK